MSSTPNPTIWFVRRAFLTIRISGSSGIWITPRQIGGIDDADIDAPEAWDRVPPAGPEVVVAVIDSGIDYNHQDLRANMFRNEADCDNDGVDDDLNTFVDDCYGIDTAYNDSDPMDDFDHGTHVAGIIGAVGNNGIGVIGVSPNVRLMACKFIDGSGFGSIADAIDCLEYVATMKDRGVNIVATSNSWGGGPFAQALYDAIEIQRQRGILFIAAAGNDGFNNDVRPTFPSSYYLPNVLAVAASDQHDALAGFSNFGRTVHVAAPGVKIRSTSMRNPYQEFDGTSVAAPHVTGVAALLKADKPSRDWRAIKNLILAGGDSKGGLAPIVTGKRLNAYGALTCRGDASGLACNPRFRMSRSRKINP